MILIGNGGHARDIASTQDFDLVVGHHENFVAVVSQFVIGVNDPQVRAKIAADIGRPGETWVHPDALIGIECDIAPHDVHVNYGVRMTRVRIGQGTTISPGVTICGDVTIGDRCLIGAGAVICDRVTIGDDVKVGAGAVVLPGRTIGSNTTAVGVPALVYVGGHE